MALGTFKWFDVESGYGLISPDDGGRNLFVRSTDMASSSLLEALEKGTKVAYEVHQDTIGTRAAEERAGSRSARTSGDGTPRVRRFPLGS